MDIMILQSFIASWGAILIPVILGITEIAKGVTNNKYNRFSPAFSVVLGVLLGLLVVGFSRSGVFVGIVIGLSSSGLWSFAKMPVKTKKG